MTELTVEFTFAAAHRLPRYQGPCFDLHGHNYTLLVTIRGEPSPESGMIIDFHALEAVVQERLLKKCDHKYFNDFIENPTAEAIIKWMWAELAPHLPQLEALKLYEMPRYFVEIRRETP